ncbi:RNB domain-containing ribonuclease [Serinibacter salmoneus]|uniref:Exoribonuclease R n=1 Tax=Serinibacter salmoneus TaxID=556530 RepID=A0A2A9CXS5_9MICO|nr:RNB domain-containing ribonuclease [Serinibacter salmoneus]PFG18815.1 exoribonuclease R [Serinibacter salmoneus]
MALRAVRAGAAAEEAAPLLAALRADLDIPEDYDPAALAEAEEAAAQDVWDDHDRVDLREVPFVTLDPPGARDLDQAFHLAADGDGFLLEYAIADVASYVTPGGPLDAETHRRGLTVYGPDGRNGLHPPVLSEDAASLLEGQDRRAAVWRLRFDAAGTLADATVRRAVVRSRAQLAYAEVQAELDDGSASEPFVLLARLGALRAAAQIARGGASIDVPEQEVHTDGEGEQRRYHLVSRVPLPIEDHNAHLSLATGIAAARLQREAGVGLWRTLDPADERDVDRLRGVARSLGLDWPAEQGYGAFAAGLQVGDPAAAAFATEAVRLFRGAGYVAFGTPSAPQVPEGATHSAIAAEYAHVTAPLRRLVDRYGTEIALAHCAGTPVPAWVSGALETMPGIMAASASRANTYDRQAVDLLEALVLRDRVGQRLRALVLNAGRPKEDGVRADVLLSDPVVRTRVVGPEGALRPGTHVDVVIRAVDVPQRQVELALSS